MKGQGIISNRTTRIIGFKYDNGSDGIDKTTNAQYHIDYEHHEIHAGSHYYLEDVQDLALNNVFDLQWVTSNSAKWEHLTFILNCESETEWYIYEGASIVNAGSVITPVNNNRNSTNTSLATITSQSNTSVANANIDTPVAAATELNHGIIGAGREGGITGRDKEIILKQNTIYCMRAIANAAGYVNFYVSWYEHTSKN